MIRKYIYFLLFSILMSFLFGCKRTVDKARQVKRNSVAEVENIIIDLKENRQLPYDKLIDKAEFIKLETKGDNIIGRISQVLFVDSVIVVVDSENAKSIFVFDMKGKFKCKVGGIGGASDEFVEISNVIITPDKKRICVLDRPQRKMLYFDLNGQFISYTRQPFSLSYFEYIDSGHLAFDVHAMFDYAYGPNKGNALIVTDSVNTILYGTFEDTYRSNFTYCHVSPLRKFDNQVYFSPNFSDSIYIIEKDRIIPKYYIDIKTNGMPKFDRRTITNNQIRKYMYRYFYFDADYIELKDLTFINLKTPTGYPMAIYSHRKKEVVLTTGTFSNPLYAFFNYAPIARYKENGVVFPIDSYQIYNAKKELYKLKDHKVVLDELYHGLDTNSNPVLFIYHLNINM